MRATPNGLDYPDPNVNGLQTAGGAGYTHGERHINPRIFPKSPLLTRTHTPIYRVPVDARPFQVYPVNLRAGGRVVS